jgi:hypothetical protein
MNTMFRSASAFDQDLSCWNVALLPGEATLFAAASPLNINGMKPVWGTTGGCPFTTTWKSDNPGGLTNQIIIPTRSSSGPYNYDVYYENISNASQNGTLTGNT